MIYQRSQKESVSAFEISYYTFQYPNWASDSFVPCFLFFFFNFYLFYFWLHWVFIAARGLFSGCGEWGLLFVAVRRLLIVVASLVVEHGL